MRIRFYQAGGLVGRVAAAPLEIETSELTEDEASELTTLVEEAKACPSGFVPTAVRPDALYYRVEVDHLDGLTNEWEASDGEMPSELRRLVSWLRLRNQRS